MVALPRPPLVRPRPAICESWPGHLLRVAECNYLPRGIRSIAALVNQTPYETLARRPQTTLRRLGIKWQVRIPPVEEERVRQNAKRLELREFGRSRRTRFCPACLRRDREPFFRSYWDQPMELVCHTHGTLNIDMCPECGNRIDCLRLRLTSCNCGCDFLRLTSAGAPKCWETVKKVFHPAFSVKCGTFARIQPVQVCAARVTGWLCLPRSPLDGRRNGRHRDRDPFLTASQLPSLEELFNNWPKKTIESVLREVDTTNLYSINPVLTKLQIGTFQEFRAVEAALHLERHLYKLGMESQLDPSHPSGEVLCSSFGR